MINITFFAILILLIAIFLTANKNKKKTTQLASLSDLKNITKKEDLLTSHEQKMYFELTAAVPGCIVLAQVAFSALLTSKNRATRNRFDRKIADYVVCNKTLTVIAVIELDDSSHKGKEQDDAERDAMLKNAGYNTLRYSKIPTRETIQADIATLIRAT